MTSTLATAPLPANIQANCAAGKAPQLSRIDPLGWVIHPWASIASEITEEDLIYDNTVRRLTTDEVAKIPALYAAVLTDHDGFADDNTDRVWGTGRTPDEARDDVRNWTDPGESQDRLVSAVEIYPLTLSQARAIENGTVQWNALLLVVTAQERAQQLRAEGRDDEANEIDRSIASGAVEPASDPDDERSFVQAADEAGDLEWYPVEVPERRVVTYRLAYLDRRVSLCDSCAIKGEHGLGDLGPVVYGGHMGRCDCCDA